MKTSTGLCAALLSIAPATSGGRPLDTPPSPAPGSPAPQGSPSPGPTPTPTPSPSPPAWLRLDVDKHVRRVLTAAGALPRFEESVEVQGKSPQVLLERQLQGVDLECGPTGGGAPTAVETRAVRPHPAPYADFLALARAFAGKLKANDPPRYFLYRVRRSDEVSYLLREGRIPEWVLYNTPGTAFELIESFADFGAAVRATRRVERGLPPTGSSADPLAPWVTYPCRPPK